MASAHFRARKQRSGVVRYYAEFYDPARTPTAKSHTLRTADEKRARATFAKMAHAEAVGAFDPWTQAWSGDGPASKGQRVTLADAAGRYLAARAHEVRTNTVEHYRASLAHLLRLPHGRGTLAEAPVAAVTAEHVHAALAAIPGRLPGATGPAPATRAASFIAIRTFLSYSQKQGLLLRNPLDGHDAPPVEVAPFHAFTPAEVVALAGVFTDVWGARTKTAERAYLADLVHLMAGSGLRISEALQLRWADVAFTDTAATLHVVHDPRRGLSTKSGKSRHVHVWPVAAQALERLRALHGGRARPADPVALSPRGAVPNAKRFAALFREARELSGIGGDGTPHDLRHAFISWSVNEMNVPLTVVQAMAGHSDIKTTAAYQRVTNVSMLEATTRALRLAGVAVPTSSTTVAADAVALYLSGSKQ